MRLTLLLLAVAVQAAPQPCADCHPKQSGGSPMSHALAPGANRQATVTLGRYRYTVDGAQYSVTDGVDTQRFPIAWTFGHGVTGQTYLFQREGKWLESRVSYFAALQGLDLTFGANPNPQTLAEAAGRAASNAEVRKCIGCHSTGTIPGIQCERCHGSTGQHPQMPKLGAMKAEESANFCGQCHRTWEQIARNGPRGIANVRFQPYRLAGSRCFDGASSRIKCTTCHDPHTKVETAATAYDAKCQVCHTKPCPKGKAECPTCHMPKLDLPGAHAKFTDHHIRVVKPNEVYPE